LLAPAACTDTAGFHRLAALCVIAAAWLPAVAEARGLHRYPTTARYEHRNNVPRQWPFEFPGSQYAPVAFADLPGWTDDDHLQAFKAFRVSCNPIAAQRKPTDANASSGKTLGGSLRDPCLVAKAADVTDEPRARAFFENNFTPLRISRLGETDGFVTGYYEPVFDGSLVKTDDYPVPLYRRPSNLFVRGHNQADASLPNGGDVFRKIGRRKLVPYYDRAQIEDGAIAGRGLEIAWLKSQTDLLFAQIQGSARITLPYGHTLRINYDSHNGYRYTPVGRILIDRGLVPRDQMSMQRIRQWMEQNPDGSNELRRQNRAFVFFHEVQLSDNDEAVGAQGVPLTPGRSIAVDKTLHVYGTPFFIEGELPVESEQSKKPFHRLMVAQDTGSAIVGPARADLYFGAGVAAGRVAGRMRHAARFVMLVPNSLDPTARGRTMPLPDARPSEKIARLFPQTEPARTELDKTKPARIEPTKTEPTKTEPARTELAKTDPAKTEPAKTESTKTDPAKTEPNRTEPTKTEPSKTGPATVEPPVPATVTPLPEPKPAAIVAAPAVPPASPAVAVPLPEARPAAATQVTAEAKPQTKAETRHEARARRAKPRHRMYRRAARPSQPQSLFRFPWQ
jgi:membrane-bound lytic murein transglycosylase A